MAKGDRYLIYADTDDAEVKIHGPMSSEQAEGFYSGAEWINDSALEYLGAYGSIKAAREASAEMARVSFTDYEVLEMGFEVPQLAVSQGDLYLLYLDGEGGVLKMHGPMGSERAEGFYSGAEWVNDSSIEYLGIYAGAEVVRAAAQEYGGGGYEVDEMAVERGFLLAEPEL